MNILTGRPSWKRQNLSNYKTARSLRQSLETNFSYPC